MPIEAREFTDLPYLATRVFNCPVALEKEKFSAIINALMPRFRGTADMAYVNDRDREERKPYQITPEGVAVIGVHGTLVNKASGMRGLSGLTSYERINADMTAALYDPAVKAILFDINSPGGEVGGMFDLTDRVFEARGPKPIFAIADDLAASAAYAIGSAATKLFVTRTAVVGSVGITALHVDQSGADKQQGLKYTFVYAGNHKTDANPHAPLTDQAHAMLQDRVDKLYAMFVDTVARNRDITAERVRKTEALTYMGADGIKAQLADELTTFDGALALIGQSLKGSKTFSMVASAAMTSTKGAVMEEDTKTAADATQTPPVDVAAIKAEAQKAGYDAAAEVVELCAMTGRLDLVAGFIAERKSVADVKKALLAARAATQDDVNITSQTLPKDGTSSTKNDRGPEALRAVIDARTKGAK